MGNKMLIDATHPEETRVVVLRGNRVEEFDFEAAAKKQLRGNIYLAKVTRVEPSLQAAFVNYGGNRHGFLAFNEIHPDYYQLPMAERQALKREDERARKRALAEDGEGGPAEASVDYEADEDEDSTEVTEATPADEDGDPASDLAASEDEAQAEDDGESAPDAAIALEAALPAAKYSADLYDETLSDQPENGAEAEARGDESGDAEEAETGNGPENAAGDERTERNGVESVGSEDALEELPERHRRRRRVYKIQEVIKRGQIILVQVVKEERGNKGAALTTYLSLAGRYTVLMPNTGSGGGISRKISSPGDRKRLREIAGELDVPDGMGLIIRTAGAARTKTEIKRDYEYLLRLWENVRELTLKSSAPALVYEEGDLIKRSIRDLYSREIDEVLVAGDDAYRDAKDFMHMLMPSHAKNVQPYKDSEPLFTRYEVERQLNAMFSPQVTLPSGGYVVLNQTEALVAIDVNSGKATREFSIEDTALKTNMEAAEEVARQLRLRDLAGLIVVDFIDMEEKRNNRAVERRLKECLRNDRARIQVGHISHFGLLEMSRQRLRTGMIEGSTTQCPHCQGTGVIRSTESVALSVLRSLEDWLRTNPPADLAAVTSVEVALYILNQKRGYLNDIEARYGVSLSISASERMHGANFYIEKASVATPATASQAVKQTDRIIQPFEDDGTGLAEAADDDTSKGRRRRRKRRGRGEGGETRPRERAAAPAAVSMDIASEESPSLDALYGDREEQPGPAEADGEEEGGTRRRPRRRGRRGGRHQRGTKRAGEGVELMEGQEAPAGEEDTETAESVPAEAEAPMEAGPALAEAAERVEPEAPMEVGPALAEAAERVEPEPVAAAEPLQPVMPAGGDFHTLEPVANLEGRVKKNGILHEQPEQPAAEATEEAGGDDAPLAEKPQPEMIRKPRGNRRGWWQRRA